MTKFLNIELNRDQILTIINSLIIEAHKVKLLIEDEETSEKTLKNKIINFTDNMQYLYKIATTLKLNREED